MRFLVTGASGFIGSILIAKWLADESVDEVIALTRSPARLNRLYNKTVTVVDDLTRVSNKQPIDAVINLAGEPILDKRWNEARKNILYDSRLAVTDHVLQLIARLKVKPGVLISGSAIGFYGSHVGDRELTELGASHPCFAHHLCHDWENKAQQAENLGVRVCLIRTGVVLGRGGALTKMLPLFKLGLGGVIGHGRQWMSWIDIIDMVNAIDFLIRHQTLSGPFNLTSPNPVTNYDFTKSLGNQLNRPTILPMPALVLRLMLGEGAELLVEGQRVVPEKLLEAGFSFNYPDLEQSLAHCLGES